MNIIRRKTSLNLFTCFFNCLNVRYSFTVNKISSDGDDGDECMYDEKPLVIP